MTIPLIGPDGRAYEMDDPAKVAEAVKLGYRVVSPDAPQTLGESIKGAANDAEDVLGAGIQGVGQGATAGLLGAAVGAPQMPDETPEDYAMRRFDASELERRKAAHPNVALAGELAGAVVSPLNKIGTGVTQALKPVTALGRIGSTVAGGATVGALYGAGNTLSDAALGDHEVTAEKLFAGAGLGAVLGGGGAGLGGAVEEGIRSAIPAMGRLASKVRLDAFADDAAVAATRAQQGVIGRMTEKDLAAAAGVLRDRGHLSSGASADDILKSLTADRAKEAKSLLDAMGIKADLAHTATAEEARAAIAKGLSTHGDEMGRVYDVAEAAGVRPVMSELRAAVAKARTGLNPAEADYLEPHIARIEGFLDDLGSRPAGSNSFRSLNDLRGTLQSEIAPLYRAGDSNAARLRKGLVGSFKDALDEQFERALTRKAWVGGPKDFDAYAGAKRAAHALYRAEDAVGRESATGADAIRAMLGATGLQSPSVTTFNALGAAEELARSGTKRAGGFGMKDIGAAIIGGQIHPAGMAAAIASKFMREHGPGVVAKLADAIAKAPALAATAQGFAAKLPTVAQYMGEYAQPMLQAVARSPAHALAQHMTQAATDPQYAAAAERAGFLPETHEEYAAATKRAEGLAGVARVAADADDAIRRGVDRVLTGASPKRATLSTQDFGAKRMRRDALASHEQRMKEIQQLAADPSALVDKVAANLGAVGDVAPGVAAAVTRKAHDAVAFLASELNIPPKAGPLAPEWTPTDAEVHTFTRALETVQDPLSVLQHAAAGTLTEDQVRALNRVYPRLGQQMGDQLLGAMAGKPHAPYRAKLMLGMLTGIDPDGTMGQVAANQAAIQASSRKPSNDTSGQSPLTLAERTALPGQQLEE